MTVLVAGGCYVAAGLVATTMRKDLLGPDRTTWQPARLGEELARVAAGLLAGARYVLRQRQARAALGAIGGFGLLFGPLFLMAIILYRNYFYPAHATTAASHVAVLAAASAVGYGLRGAGHAARDEARVQAGLDRADAGCSRRRGDRPAR